MITTKKGDTGFTDLSGIRVKKNDDIIELLGIIDSCIAQIVISYNFSKDEEFKLIIDELSLLAGIFSGYVSISSFNKNAIARIEQYEVMTLKEFSYPFDDPIKAQHNLVRTYVRSIERQFYRCFETIDGYQDIAVYLNRLSDFMFMKSL